MFLDDNDTEHNIIKELPGTIFASSNISDSIPAPLELSLPKGVRAYVQDIQDKQALVAINITIGQAEKWAARSWAITFLEYILADDFRFRRAIVEVVTKKDYLEALTSGARTYEYVDSDDVKVDVSGGRATVTLRVATKGYNNNRLIEGQFCNIRTFEKREGRWQIFGWQNTQMTQP